MKTVVPWAGAVTLAAYAFACYAVLFSVEDRSLLAPPAMKVALTPVTRREVLATPASQSSRAEWVWFAHVSVPLFDRKGSDGRFLQVAKALSNDDHHLLYLGWTLERGQEEYHSEVLRNQTKVSHIMTPAYDAWKAGKDAKDIFPCDKIIMFFWPTTDYWKWLAELAKFVRKEMPSCQVVVLVDELMWPRWKAIQDAGADMEQYPWITKRWDLLRVNMLKFFTAMDKIAVISSEDQDVLARALPSRSESMFLLPYSVSVSQTTTPWENLSGVLFTCGDMIEHAPFLRVFLPGLVAILPEDVGPVHITGGISAYLKDAFDTSASNNKRVVIHSHVDESTLLNLENSVLAAINPLPMRGGVSTKVLRAFGRGLPVVATPYSYPLEFRQGGFCKIDLPICKRNNLRCFWHFLILLSRDRNYWETIRNCGLDFITEHNSEERLQTALRTMLAAPPYSPPEAPLQLPPKLMGNGVYIAAILRNIEGKWAFFSKEVLDFVRNLTQEHRPVFVSFVSSNNQDRTPDLLKEFSGALMRMGVPHDIRCDVSGKKDPIFDTNRPAFLAEQRNKALKHLTRAYGTTVFLNDIYVYAADLLALLNTPVEYDMVCGLDFSMSDFNLLRNLTVARGPRAQCFYDIWVARDIDGSSFRSHFPWATMPQSVEALKLGRPFQVASCWNGVVAFRSELVLVSNLQFRGAEPSECALSECHLWCKDMWDLGFTRTFINPRVQSAYEKDVFEHIQYTDYYKFVHSLSTALEPLPVPLVTERPRKDVCCLVAPGQTEPVWEACQEHYNIHRLTVAIIGNVLDDLSFSEANRNMAMALSKSPLLLPKILLFSAQEDPYFFLTDLQASKETLASIYFEPTSARQVDIAIHMSWPPLLTKLVAAKKHAVELPWEFGSLPAHWISKLQKFDEVWVPTTYLKSQYERDGLARSKLHLIPNFVSETYFQPHKRTWDFRTSKGFNFLFIGGLLRRKGVDAMLRAYAAEFSPYDDVCLTVVSQYTTDFKAEENLRAWSSNASLPCLQWHERKYFPVEDLATMMASASAYVATYRAEGFGLPVVQAMALGTPLIVTRGGASDDYAWEETAVLVDSHEVPCQGHPCQDDHICVFDTEAEKCRRTVVAPIFLEPDHQSIRTALRFAVSHPDEIQRRAQAAKRMARERFAPDSISSMIASRISPVPLQAPLYPASEAHLSALAKREWGPQEQAAAEKPPSDPTLVELLTHLKELEGTMLTEERFEFTRARLRALPSLAPYIVHFQCIQKELFAAVPEACLSTPMCQQRLQLLIPALKHIFRGWSFRDFEFLMALKPVEEFDTFPLISFRSVESEGQLLVPDPLLLEGPEQKGGKGGVTWQEGALTWQERTKKVVYLDALTTASAVKVAAVSRGLDEVEVNVTGFDLSKGALIQKVIELRVHKTSPTSSWGEYKGCLMSTPAWGSRALHMSRLYPFGCAMFLVHEPFREYWRSAFTDGTHFISLEEDLSDAAMKVKRFLADDEALERVALKGSHAVHALGSFESGVHVLKEALTRYVEFLAPEFIVEKRDFLVRLA